MDNKVTPPGLAMITATYNEEAQLSTWQAYYAAIADEIDLHIVVDDGSVATQHAQLKAAFPHSVMLRNPVNQGQIVSNNRGFNYALAAGARYIGVVVPDFRIPPDTLRQLCAALDADHTLSGISAVLIKPGSLNEVESFGGQLNKRKATLVSYNVGSTWQADWDGIALVDTLPGGFHILRREALERVGLQNEQLFMYCDETDFGWRAEQAGLKFGILRSSRVWHEHVSKGGKTRSAMAPYLVSRNRMLVMRMYGRRLDQLILIIGRLITLVPAMVDLYRREGTSRHALAYAWGLWHGILGRNGRPPQAML